MVLSLVLLTLMACIVADYLLTRRRVSAAEATSARARMSRAVVVPAIRGVAGIVTPEALYYHPGHTWVAVEGPASVRVGVDDFARRLAGHIKELAPPTAGRSVRQGLPIWTLSRDGQSVAMLSPVDGVVEELNPAVVKDPNVAWQDPYGGGWVARVRVAELGRNLRNLLHGSVVDHWMEDAVEKLYSRFEGRLGPVMADGGLLQEDVSAMLTDEDWTAICREHFVGDFE